MISVLTELFDPLFEVLCVLAINLEKATVYFLLAIISGFLLGSTCICGHWIALKLAPITDEPSSKSGKSVQTDEVGGIRLSGMTPSITSTQVQRRNGSENTRRENNNHRYMKSILVNDMTEIINHRC